MVNHINKIKNSRVVVTGGLGFVGHNLVKTLLNDHQCQVVVADDCSNSDEKVLGTDRSKIEFHRISVMDKERMMPLLDDADYVFHLACKQISSSASEPKQHLEVNAESTLNLLEYIRHKQPARLKRFVYTGSTSIYGSTAKLPVSETDSPFVLSNYAATKLLGENFTLMYSRNYDLPTSVVRYSNIYGFGQTPLNPYCGVLGKFIHKSLKNEELTVIGDGEQTRDYTFISDAVNATILAAVHPRAYGDVFNIGTTTETSVNDLITIISEFVQGVKVVSVPERDIDNIRRRSIDISKIHNNLGWSPMVNIREGIRRTLDWYRREIIGK